MIKRKNRKNIWKIEKEMQKFFYEKGEFTPDDFIIWIEWELQLINFKIIDSPHGSQYADEIRNLFLKRFVFSYLLKYLKREDIYE